MKHLALLLWSQGGIVLPFFASSSVLAQERYSLKGVVDTLISIIGGFLIPISVAILFFVFVHSIIRFLLALNAGERDVSGLAGRLLLNPILVLFFIFTMWGILYLIRLLFSS